MIQTDEWLAPIDGDSPAGIELRGLAQYDEILRFCEPTVEPVYDELNQVSDTVARAPDWKGVLEAAQTLSHQGKDLRLLAIVTRALFELDGLAGLRDGLHLLNDTCANFWDSLHPELKKNRSKLDAPRARLNALRQIEGTKSGVLGSLRSSIILTPSGDDPITGRDLAEAMRSPSNVSETLPELTGEAERRAATEAQTKLIRRVKSACRNLLEDAPETFDKLRGEISGALSAVESLEKTVADKLGEEGPDFALSKVGEVLRGMKATFTDAVKDRPVSQVGAEVEAEKNHKVTPKPLEANMSSTLPSAAPGLATAAGAPPGTINSREDVLAALDRIIAFYARTEPASPVPLVAERMRRMVTMSFLELLEDLAPAGVKEFRSVAGLAPPDKKGQQS